MPVHLTCPTCGTAFTRKASYVAKHAPVFCTRECHTLSRRNPPIEISDDGLTGRIALLARDGSVKAHAIIDAGDAEWAGRYTWGLSMGYAVRRVYKGRHMSDERIYLHRELMGLTAGDTREIDHINRNKLDNRRANLRVVSREENAQNLGSRPGTSSKHRGVSLIAVTGKWKAVVNVGGQRHYAGQFSAEHEAAEAARAARTRLMPYAVD